MKYRVVDNFGHLLRAGLDLTPAHDDLRPLYENAIVSMKSLADGLYKRERRQIDEHDL